MIKNPYTGASTCTFFFIHHQLKLTVQEKYRTTVDQTVTLTVIPANKSYASLFATPFLISVPNFILPSYPLWQTRPNLKVLEGKKLSTFHFPNFITKRYFCKVHSGCSLTPHTILMSRIPLWAFFRYNKKSKSTGVGKLKSCKMDHPSVSSFSPLFRPIWFCDI